MKIFQNTQAVNGQLPVTAPSQTNDNPSNQNNQLCSNSCLAQIFQATSSSKSSLITITPTSAPLDTPAPAASVSQVKEFFVPLGSGSNSSDDWQDVAGAKVSIDTTNYPSIKSATFEALVHIPTGNEIAYVRLFNETDKHPIWTSEMSLEGGTPQLLVSKPIALDPGSKTYKVQMKTSLKFQAILDQSRIHIITD